MTQQSDDTAARIGWTRAILTAAVIVVVGIVVCVYGTNAILTRFHSLNRGNRVGIATALFFVALFALAWTLRFLQRRKFM
jgi:hypothetical protein